MVSDLEINKEKFEMYFNLKKSYKHLEKGTKLLVAKSPAFDKDKLIDMFKEHNLYQNTKFVYEKEDKFITIFSKK